MTHYFMAAVTFFTLSKEVEKVSLNGAKGLPCANIN